MTKDNKYELCVRYLDDYFRGEIWAMSGKDIIELVTERVMELENTETKKSR